MVTAHLSWLKIIRCFSFITSRYFLCCLRMSSPPWRVPSWQHFVNLGDIKEKNRLFQQKLKKWSGGKVLPSVRLLQLPVWTCNSVLWPNTPRLYPSKFISSILNFDLAHTPHLQWLAWSRDHKTPSQKLHTFLTSKTLKTAFIKILLAHFWTLKPNIF